MPRVGFGTAVFTWFTVSTLFAGGPAPAAPPDDRQLSDDVTVHSVTEAEASPEGLIGSDGSAAAATGVSALEDFVGAVDSDILTEYASRQQLDFLFTPADDEHEPGYRPSTGLVIDTTTAQPEVPWETVDDETLRRVREQTWTGLAEVWSDALQPNTDSTFRAGQSEEWRALCEKHLLPEVVTTQVVDGRDPCDRLWSVAAARYVHDSLDPLNLNPLRNNGLEALPASSWAPIRQYFAALPGAAVSGDPEPSTPPNSAGRSDARRHARVASPGATRPPVPASAAAR